MKSAQADGEPLNKNFAPADQFCTGLQTYDLSRRLKKLYPVLTRCVTVSPRVGCGGRISVCQTSGKPLPTSA